VGKVAANVLLVEDNEDHAELVRRSFSECKDIDFKLTVANNLSSARSILKKNKPNLLITDYRLPDGKGSDLLPGSFEEREFPIIVLTGHGDQVIAVHALKSGAID